MKVNFKDVLQFFYIILSKKGKIFKNFYIIVQ